MNLNDTTLSFGNTGKTTSEMDNRELKTPSSVGENSTTFNYAKKLNHHSW